jgi:hypothetical protein
MAATFEWDEDTGANTGSPAAGATRTHNVTDVNWKNSGVQATAYTAAPITAGNNSFVKWQYGHFAAGGWNQILNGRFAHTAGALGTGLSLFGPASVSSDGTRPLYTSVPGATRDATSCPTDITSVIAIGSGVTVWFGLTGPEATGKAASLTSTGAAAYTTYLPTQLVTTASAAAGDTATVTLTLQYDEN